MKSRSINYLVAAELSTAVVAALLFFALSITRAQSDAKKTADNLNASLGPAGFAKEVPPKVEKALPAKVTLTDETDRVRMVQLRLTAIVNESQTLRERLAKLEEAAKREQADLNVAITQAIVKHGLKPEDLPKYDFRNVEPLDTGPIVLIKKADVPDTPKAEPKTEKK